MRNLIGWSRFMLLIAVLGSLASAAVLLVYTSARTVVLVGAASASPPSSKGLKALSLGLIEAIDGFLVATVFVIIGVGLYGLFIDPETPLPSWLVIRKLGDLKDKLASLVVVVLAVLFLGQIVTWDGERDLLGFGAAVALVIAALTYFLSPKERGDKQE